MFGMGPTELIIVFAVIMLLFGANRIPQVARSLGKSVGEFKRGLADQPDAEKKSDAKNDEKPKEA